MPRAEIDRMPRVLLALGLRLSGMVLLIRATLDLVNVAYSYFSNEAGGVFDVLYQRILVEALLLLVAGALLIRKASALAAHLDPAAGPGVSAAPRLLMASVATITCLALATGLATLASMLLYVLPSHGDGWQIYRNMDRRSLHVAVATLLTGLIGFVGLLVWGRHRRRQERPAS